MLAKRLVTGACFILALIALLWLDDWLGPVSLGSWTIPPGLILAIVGGLIVSLACVELARVASATGIRTSATIMASSSVAVMVATWLTPAFPAAFNSTIPLTIIAITLLASLAYFSRGRQVDHAFASSAVVMLAVIYLGVLSGFLLLVGAQVSIWMIGGVALVVKSCDIGAYFTGMAIGRHKLIPWLSPAKTVEGLLGGIITSMAVSVILDAALGWPLEWWWVMIMGGILALMGQAGDLVMSLFKRGAGLKDSSNLLPGLGGILDVIDSLLLAAPVAWWMLVLSLD